MKTTIELPDDLFVLAKQRAAVLRRPLRALVEAGLRDQIAGLKPKRAKRRAIRWVTVPGGAPKDLDLSSRAEMHAWIRRQK